MKKVLDFYEKIIGWLEIALNLLIVGGIGLQIITRFFFNLPLKFPEEVKRHECFYIDVEDGKELFDIDSEKDINIYSQN